MKPIFKIGTLAGMVGAILALSAGSASAQNAAITNARIIVGNGPVIENGTIIVRGGKIESVAAGRAASTRGLTVIDAKGMTAMPGCLPSRRDTRPSLQVAILRAAASCCATRLKRANSSARASFRRNA
jgi:hypothetical protein